MNKDDEQSLTTGQRAVVDAYIAMAGAGVGGALGAGFAALAAPLAVKTAGRALGELREALSRSPARVIEDASDAIGATPDEVVNRALSTERGKQLLADVLVSASGTLHESKIRAFARALANGLLGDEAQVNESQVIARALAELEEPHIRLLGRVIEESSGPKVRAFSLPALAMMAHAGAAAGAIVATMERVGILVADDQERREAEADQVRKALASQRDIEVDQSRRRASDGIRARVRQSPVVRPIRAQNMWAVSPFGRVCWQYLAAQPPDGDSPSSA